MAAQVVPYRRHLNSSQDLVTSYEETRAGFVALALERNRRATPMVEEARALQAMASQAPAPAALVTMTAIEPALLTAAGVSDKAAGHMLPEDRTEAIRGLIANFLEPAGDKFVEELVFRFLLTRGDALGGSMRNVGGVLAQRKFTRSLIAALGLARTPYRWLHSGSNKWVPMSTDDSDIELSLKGLAWSAHGRRRTILYNRTPPFVKKNIDLCLLHCRPAQTESAIGTPHLYVALGELKGGIDPAGADEHWKTARTSLSRIREAFGASNLSPRTFFVGAAIAQDMAAEIWAQLEDGTLSNAANLTGGSQLASLCAWLCTL
jgi:type II restriction enzyme